MSSSLPGVPSARSANPDSSNLSFSERRSPSAAASRNSRSSETTGSNGAQTRSGFFTIRDRFLENFRERLRKFGLELHPDKTRRIEFGRFAEQNRKRRGEGKPETFDFLGFKHISGKNRLGRFTVRRKTIRKRMGAKLRELKQQLRERMHDPVRQTGQWLKSIVQGHFNYYAVPGNLDSLSVFRRRLTGYWWHTLRRRSQKRRLSWTRMLALADRWLPQPRVLHPYPADRFAASHPR